VANGASHSKDRDPENEHREEVIVRIQDNKRNNPFSYRITGYLTVRAFGQTTICLADIRRGNGERIVRRDIIGHGRSTATPMFTLAYIGTSASYIAER